MPNDIDAAASQRKPPMQVSLLEWKPMRVNSLLGFASVRLGALKVKDVTVHASNGKRWASLPSKPLVGKDGAAQRDDRGKIKYVPILEWADRDASNRFSEAVIAAVDREHPGATDSDYAT